jgi:nicotinamide mononucleotide transporter
MPSWIEIFGFVTGAACVWLLVVESIWNWPVAIANNLFYIVVFWRAGLYADAGLQVIYIAISAYGWWHWLRGGPRRTHLSVSRLRARDGWPLAAVTAVFSAALALFLARFTPSTVPVWDASTTGLSLAAQFLQARKVLATWWVWIAADVLYIALYLYKGLWLTALLYAVFMAMCVAGLVAWRRSLVSEPVPATA